MSSTIGKTLSGFCQKFKKSFTLKKTKDFATQDSQDKKTHSHSDRKPNLFFLGCFPLPKKRTKKSESIQPSNYSKEVQPQRKSMETESSSENDEALFVNDDAFSQSSTETNSETTAEIPNTNSSELTNKLIEYEAIVKKHSNDHIENANEFEFKKIHKEIEEINRSIFEISSKDRINTPELQKIKDELQFKLRLCRIRGKYDDLKNNLNLIKKNTIKEMNPSDIRHIESTIKELEKIRDKIKDVHPSSHDLKNKIETTIVSLEYMVLTKKLMDNLELIEINVFSLKEINNFLNKVNHLETYIKDHQLENAKTSKYILTYLQNKRQKLLDMQFILHKSPKRLREQDESIQKSKKIKS